MTNDVWTIKAALDWTVGYLTRKGDENPRLSAEWLLSEATGLRRVELYVNFERPLSSEERDVLRDYVARRGAGEPLQYITGEVAFRHIAVKVRPGVLIPRPETEVLVSEALALLPSPVRRCAIDSRLTSEEAEELMQKAALGVAAEDAANAPGARLDNAASGLETGEVAVAAGLAPAASGDGSEAFAAGETPDEDGVPASTDAAASAALAAQAAPAPEPLYVADICTGSGCIACSIAYEHPQACVLATDIAPEAIELAHDNAVALGLDQRIGVLRSNLGDSIGERFMGRLSLVVSNPPYVPTSVMADIPEEVAAFEPALALDGGADGLDLFRPLTAWAFEALKPGGGYAVELHETCLDAAAEVACAAGFEGVRTVADLAGRPRVLVARKPR